MSDSTYVFDLIGGWAVDCWNEQRHQSEVDRLKRLKLITTAEHRTKADDTWDTYVYTESGLTKIHDLARLHRYRVWVIMEYLIGYSELQPAVKKHYESIPIYHTLKTLYNQSHRCKS